MTLANSPNYNQFHVVSTLKSISMWSFVLTVCMIVIGFPIFMLVVALGSLVAVTLHAIMPTHAILITTVGFLGVHIAGILAASAYLTFKGIHPQEVEWLRWLSGHENPDTASTFASCPLTCDIHE